MILAMISGLPAKDAAEAVQIYRAVKPSYVEWQRDDDAQIHVPDIGRLLPVYVVDRYEGFDALPFPELDEAALDNYLDANVAAIRSVPPPDLALANHLVMGPVILARGLEGRAPYAVKVHGSALEYGAQPNNLRNLSRRSGGKIGDLRRIR
jgi:hypothetical protein